jgi:THO complex subunit 7
VAHTVPDAIIHTRITNDERPLRRVLKKFYNYAALAHTPIVPPVAPLAGDASSNIGTVDDAREAFLVELASFHLLLKKSVMICEAEVRQVEEYQRERQRIGELLILLLLFEIDLTILPGLPEDEHGKLRGQIEQLKTSLEHEQTVRRRKIEYDLVAEKVNTLPSREELQQCVDFHIVAFF